MDAAFKRTRELYAAAYERLEAARKKAEGGKSLKDKKYVGEADLERSILDADLARAEAAFKATEVNAWDAFDEIKDQLTAELRKAVAEANTARSEDIDRNGMILLESGILRIDEVEALAER